MMTADYAIKRNDAVPVLERPARLLAMPHRVDSVLKLDEARFFRRTILLRKRQSFSVKRCFVRLPDDAYLVNLAGMKLDRDGFHSRFQFVFWQL